GPSSPSPYPLSRWGEGVFGSRLERERRETGKHPPLPTGEEGRGEGDAQREPASIPGTSQAIGRQAPVENLSAAVPSRLPGLGAWPPPARPLGVTIASKLKPSRNVSYPEEIVAGCAPGGVRMTGNRRRRKWLAFRVRTMLIIVLVIATWLGWWVTG